MGYRNNIFRGDDMKKELLAPAGDIEAGYAALYYGADAVYLGLKQFSARATANNFDENELNEFVGFAHHLGKKVFVTINTVLQQAEIQDLFKNLDICKRCHVDAIIIQDLGVARVVKKYYPEMEMHASTQMAIHNKEGAIALKNMGFSRVVLARELSLSEIKEIAKIPDLELECFIHGALCYSYSGVCQFSSIVSGRSANRGKCIYPCRSEFVKDNKFEHCFSMKDMALEEDVLKLPIYSLKIEGRKKNALYVAAVTDYYRNILDGNGAVREKAQNIKQIFSRPWCKFHFKGKNKEITDKNFVGHRGLFIGKVEDIKGQKILLSLDYDIAKHDGIQIDIEGQEKPFGFSLQKIKVKGENVLNATKGDKVEILLPVKVDGVKKGDNVYLASSSKVKGAYGYQKPRSKEFLQRYEICVELKLEKDLIQASACGEVAKIRGKFDKAQNLDKIKKTVLDVFAKTGDTELKLVNIQVDNKDDIFVPISVLNELRRNLYEQIVPDYCSTQPENINARKLPVEEKWIVKTDNVVNVSLLDWSKISEVIFLISPNTKLDDIRKLPKNKVRIALPTICRKVDDFAYIINKLLDDGYKKWEIGNYWGLSVLPVKKLDLSFDSLIYMFNFEAIQAAKECGASRVTLPVEDTLSNMKNLVNNAPLPLVMIVYQDSPLFTSAVCIRNNSCGDCKKDKQWLKLQGKDNMKYEVLSDNCQTMLFAEKPYSVADYSKDVRADFYRADFCYKHYSPQDVKNIMDELMTFQRQQRVLKANVIRNNDVF